jgi:hypothetical protein
VDARIQDVQEQAIVVTVFNITGNIKSSQDVYFRQKQKEPMTGLWSTSWMSGTRSLVKNDTSSKRLSATRAKLIVGM